MDPTGTPKLPRQALVHLITSLTLALVPLVLGISLAVTEHSAPDRIIPWSSAQVGFGSLKGDLHFALTQFSLCHGKDSEQCTRLYYEDQSTVLGDDAFSISKAGRAINIMVIIGTCLTAIATILSLFTLVKRVGGLATREAKLGMSAMMGLATLLFFISAIVWASSVHDRLSKYSSDLHYSWGFALSLVAGLLSGGAAIVQCLRPTADDYVAVL